MKEPNYLFAQSRSQLFHRRSIASSRRRVFYNCLLFVAAGLLMMIGALIARDEQKARQAERLATYDWYDEDCFARRDINWVLHGINE